MNLPVEICGLPGPKIRTSTPRTKTCPWGPRTWGTRIYQSKLDVAHPSRKYKNVARVGHPHSCGILHGHLRSIKAGIALAIAVLFLLILSGCGHQQTAASLPAPQAA